LYQKCQISRNQNKDRVGYHYIVHTQ